MEIGDVEAKNKLSMLLDRVETGQEIVITRDGKPVARLIPHAVPVDRSQASAALDRIRSRVADSKKEFDLASLEADRDARRPGVGL